MTMTKLVALGATAILLASTSSVFAQQGTTLAGPAQGSKENGASSATPSGAGASTSGTTASGSSGGSNAGNQPTATSEQHEKLGN